MSKPPNVAASTRLRFFRQILVACTAVIFAMVADQNSAAAQPNVPNPPWPASCPLRLTLVVDQSSSMIARFPDVREAARNVVDALRDRKSEVSIIGFGTDAEIVSQAVDVSHEEARHELKDRIDTLAAHEGDASATNWEAALTAARDLEPDVVVLVTDGFPNVYGNPVEEGPETDAVAAAAAAADQLKSAGTRIAAVGVDLEQGGEANLRAITGNNAGDDYYVTGTDGLLRQLYGIVADSCGVPIAALPRPEPPEFPWGRAILGTLAGLALLTGAAFLLHRRRRAGTGARPVDKGATAHVRRIDHSHLAAQLRRGQSEKTNPHSTKDQP